MNILLIGGAGSFINNVIIKLNKEGHKIYLLTGSRYTKKPYQKVFERYDFPYDSSCINEIFESVKPDVTIYMGAYDTNFKWRHEEKEAVKFSASLMNILMGYAMHSKGKFIYLSNQEVYGGSCENDISEAEPASPEEYCGMALAQAEEMCESYRRSRSLDIITLRLDNVYSVPSNRKEAQSHICGRMCLEALKDKSVHFNEDSRLSLLYETDAAEFIYRVVAAPEHKSSIYNISSSREISERELVSLVEDGMGEPLEAVVEKSAPKRLVLSNELYKSDYGDVFFCETADIIKKIADKMKKSPAVYLTDEERELTLVEKIFKKLGWLIRAVIPFLENFIAFIIFFMLNNRATDSDYFSRLDFYLLYVLLFAIVHGQQQATLSAVLAVIGYIFRQSYTRSGFEIMLDANTYVWIAQLFILGLIVGYMRDQLAKVKAEIREEKDYLSMQLSDIQDINSSNVRVKDALETQIVNQNDSIGKIYSITSALDQYSQEEVLFYAAEMLGKLVNSSDVAIYTVSNRDYARLFSSTSKTARQLGNSLRYTETGEMYQTLSERKVYVNRKMDARYPLMANAIFENDKMQIILMVWGISWENMTLSQSNQLVVVSALIQNAVLRANRYVSALEDKRYVEDSQMLETDAFATLLDAYTKAEGKGLTECTVLKVNAAPGEYTQAGKTLSSKLRQTDYIGTLKDGGLYALLANTGREDAEYVMKRFEDAGYSCRIVEGRAG